MTMTDNSAVLPLVYEVPFVWADRGVERLGTVLRRIHVPLRTVPEGAMEAAPRFWEEDGDPYLPTERRSFEGATWRRPAGYRDGMSRERWAGLFDDEREPLPQLSQFFEDAAMGRRGRFSRVGSDCPAYARMVEGYEPQAETWARHFADAYVVCGNDGPWVREEWPYSLSSEDDEEESLLKTMNRALKLYHRVRKPDAEAARFAGLVRRFLVRGVLGDLEEDETREAALVLEEFCRWLQVQRGFLRGGWRKRMGELQAVALDQASGLVPEVPDEDVDALAAAGQP